MIPVVLAAAVMTDLSEVRVCRPLDGGDVLVGTGGGLAWFDARGGLRARWTAVDGLPGTRIDGISQLDDHMWIGTEAGAADVMFDGGKLRILRTVRTKAVRQVIEFAGATYFATWDGGVVKDGRAIKLVGGNNRAKQARVSSLAVADGALWAGTQNGLYRLTNGTFELTAIEAGANEVAALYADGDKLWIGTTAGLYAREGGLVRGYGGGDVRSIAKIDGAIAIATFAGGLQKVDRGRLVSYGPKQLAMAQALADGPTACAGGLDGLWLKAGDWKQVKLPAGPPSNDISAIAFARGKIYVGTFDHGLAVLDGNTWTNVSSDKLDRRINALLADGDRLWIATAAGLTVMQGDTFRQLGKADGLPARGILALTKLADGRLLVGTSAGAAIVGTGRPALIGAKQGLEAKNVWAVAEDADGWIWLGTTTGLFRGRADDTQWTRYSVATGHLRDDWVMALATRGTSLWVGTYKGGVTRFDVAGDTIVATPLGDGWINPGGLRWIGDLLYAATMEGVRTGDGTSAAWTAVTGLPGRDATGTMCSDGDLLIATRRGLVRKKC